MTLKQAFTNWSMAPKNIALAAKSRSEVQLVLMKKYADIDLEQITETFARRIFKQQSSLPQETLTKAAAVLVYLLEWGAENGHCQAPTFDTSVAYVCLPEEPMSQEANDHLTMGEYANQKPAPVRNKRPVAQIDTKTLQVIKIWPSVTKAHTELHIQNIDRAIHRRGIAGGYFWCEAKDADTFKPASNADKLIGRPKKSAAPEQKPTPDKVPASVAAAANFSASVPFPVDKDGRVQVPNNPLIIYDDQQLIDELKRRGYKGTLSITKQITL